MLRWDRIASVALRRCGGILTSLAVLSGPTVLTGCGNALHRSGSVERMPVIGAIVAHREEQALKKRVEQDKFPTAQQAGL